MAAPSKKPKKNANANAYAHAIVDTQLSSESARLSTIVKEVLDLEIHNILHDVVLKAHRQFRAEQDARPFTQAGSSDSKAGDEISKAVSNLPICPTCNLPRLLYPTKGAGSRPPPDPSISYCATQPPVKMPGHDVNGNPFATDKPPYKSKMKKAQREAAQATSPQPSQNSGSPPVSPREGSINSSQKPPTSAPNEKEKPFVTFPERKCPNPECQRYMPVARIAKHLDRCLGISGRQSSRNAMEKMGTGAGNTPAGSRAGTPAVVGPVTAQSKKRAAEDDDTSNITDSVKKKKLKLSSPKKKDTIPLAKEKKGSALKNETIGETVVAVKKED